MQETESILIAVDDSAASEKAVTYAARVLHGTDGCRVRLFHVLEPIHPPWVSVHGDLDTVPTAADGDLEARAIGEAQERSRPLLTKMAEILVRAGLERDRIETAWFVASREDSLPFEIVAAAREAGTSTVVVGHTALPWYRELFHRHVGESLLRKGEDLSIWVVA